MKENSPNNADIKLIEQLMAIHASSCYNELVALSQKSSLLSRIDKDKSETILSKFIKNILDDLPLNNALPIAPMGLLLRYVAAKSIEKGDFLPIYVMLLTNPKVNVETSYINTEEVVDNGNIGKKTRRIDIFAEGKIRYADGSLDDVMYEERFCLVIENKIKSSQHDDQCKEYYKYVENKYKDVPHRFYVYLDPKEGEADCDAYVNMSYNDFMMYVLDPLLSEAKHLGGKIPNDYYRDLIELIDTLQHPAEFMSDQPIALSQEYRDLLSRFYRENRELILLAAKECADDDDFKTIENGFVQRRNSVKYTIIHPNLDPVETNEKMLLQALLEQYDKHYHWPFAKLAEKFKKIGTFYKEPDDLTTGYGEPVMIGGEWYRISTQKGRKDKGKFTDIVEIARKDGFEIS